MLELLLEMTAAIKELLGTRGARAKAAIAVFRDAYILTVKHYNGEPQPAEVLEQCWKAAANAMRNVNDDIATILDRKSAYWANPAGWSAADVGATNIQLGHIRLLLNTQANLKA